jgi:N-acetyl-anhydromuramyl-L-alanine amidase AmpD
LKINKKYKLRCNILIILVLFSKILLAQDSTFSLPIKNKIFLKGKTKADSGRTIDAIIIHSSYCPKSDSFNLDCILDLYQYYNVSAHYIIDREGNITRLVEEADIAFHAGKGTMPDSNNKINTRSIGIELINTKASDYTEAQYQSLIRLIIYIKSRHAIKYILGHNQIAPTRKTDPWRFDWTKVEHLR